jgi:hypothetical protein
VARESTSEGARLYTIYACAICFGQARVGDLCWSMGADHPQPGSEPSRGGLRSATVRRAAGPVLTLLIQQRRNRARIAAPFLDRSSPAIHCGTLQHGLLDPFGMVHRLVGYDLVPEVVADERRALQSDFPHPGGEESESLVTSRTRRGFSLSPKPGRSGA